MNDKLYLFYDIAVVVTLVICFYVGAKRGLMKSLVFTALTIGAFVASWIVAEIGAPIVYNNFLKEKVISTVSYSMKGVDSSQVASNIVAKGNFGVELSKEEIDEIIVSYDDIFEGIAGTLRKNGSQASENEIIEGVEDLAAPEIVNILFGGKLNYAHIQSSLDALGFGDENVFGVIDTFLRGSNESVSESAEENLIAPIAIWIIKILIMVILFFILKLIIKPVSNLFKAVNKIPIIGPINALLGGVLNCAISLLVIYIVALLIKVIINITSNSLIFINNDTIQLTTVFKYIYNFGL